MSSTWTTTSGGILTFLCTLTLGLRDNIRISKQLFRLVSLYGPYAAYGGALAILIVLELFLVRCGVALALFNSTQ